MAHDVMSEEARDDRGPRLVCTKYGGERGDVWRLNSSATSRPPSTPDRWADKAVVDHRVSIASSRGLGPKLPMGRVEVEREVLRPRGIGVRGVYVDAAGKWQRAASYGGSQ